MKRAVRTFWISVMAGLALLLGINGCVGEKLYGPPVVDPTSENDTINNQKTKQLDQEIGSSQTILKELENE